jgi:hypothetical protein
MNINTTAWANYGRGEYGRPLRLIAAKPNTVVVTDNSEPISADPNTTYILMMSDGSSNTLTLPSSEACTVGDTITTKSITGRVNVVTQDGDSILPNMDIASNNMNSVFSTGSTVTCVASSPSANLFVLADDRNGISISFDQGTTFTAQELPVSGTQAYSSMSIDTSGIKVLVTMSAVNGINSNVLLGTADQTNHTVSWTKVNDFADDNTTWTCSSISESNSSYMIIGSNTSLYASADGGSTWYVVELVDAHPWTGVSVNYDGYVLAVASDSTINTFDMSTGVASPSWGPPITDLPDGEAWTSCYLYYGEGVGTFITSATSVYVYWNNEWIKMDPGVEEIFKVYGDFGSVILCAGRNGIAATSFTNPFDTKWLHYNTLAALNSVSLFQDSGLKYLASNQYIGSSVSIGTCEGALVPTDQLFTFIGDRLTLTYIGDQQFVVTDSYGKACIGTPFD